MPQSTILVGKIRQESVGFIAIYCAQTVEGYGDTHQKMFYFTDEELGGILAVLCIELSIFAPWTVQVTKLWGIETKLKQIYKR